MRNSFLNIIYDLKLINSYRCSISKCQFLTLRVNGFNSFPCYAWEGIKLTLRVNMLILFSLSILLSASCQKVEEKKPRYGGTLKIGHFYPIDIINPIISNSGVSVYLAVTIFSGLLKPDENFNMVPDMAERWESSEDRLKWTFFLRKKIKFHDGKELTSEDVKFTYDLIKKPEYRGYYTQFFEQVESINIFEENKYMIELVLKKPYTPFLSGLSVGILPKHIYSGKNLREKATNQHPVGSGPFKVKSYSKVETILEANKEYYDGPPYLDEIRLTIFRSQKALFAKMLGGYVDMVVNISPENIDILEQVTYFETYKFLRPYYYILAFNNKGIFKDKRLREALNYAINKEQLLEYALKNDGEIAAGTVYPKSWAFNKNVEPYPYDPQKALQLLNKAGWRDSNNNNILDKDGVELEFTSLLVAGNSVFEKSLRQIKSDLYIIGAYLKAKRLTENEYNKYIYKKNFDSVIINLSGRGDPDNNFNFWHSSQIKEGFNFFSYKNERIDRLLYAGRKEFNIEKRKDIYNDIQKEMFKDPPGILLFWANQLFVAHQKFKGIKVRPGWALDLKDWFIEEENKGE